MESAAVPAFLKNRHKTSLLNNRYSAAGMLFGVMLMIFDGL